MLRIPVLGGLLAFVAPALIAASPVGVYLDFDEPASAAAMEAMRREASGVLDRVGIEIAWRLVSQNQGNEPFERLAVVKFTGKCACEGLLAATREILVLGTTAVASGRVQLGAYGSYCNSHRGAYETSLVPSRRGPSGWKRTRTHSVI